MTVTRQAPTSDTLRLTTAFLRRDWTIHAALALWHLLSWYFVAAGFLDMSFALRWSWFALVLAPVYMLRAIARSQLLLVLPVNRREVWHATCLSAVVLPAVVQALVGLALLVLVPYRGVPAIKAAPTAEMMILAGVYSAAFVQLTLFVVSGRSSWVTAAIALPLVGALAWFSDRLPTSVSQFDATSWAIAWTAVVVLIVLVRLPSTHVAVTPERQRADGLRPGLPEVALLARLTGMPRILVTYVLLLVATFGGAFAIMLLFGRWIEGRTALAIVTEELALFGGSTVWEMQPGSTLLFMPMWVIGISNVWTPFARQLRTLPLTPGHVNLIFLLSPVLAWLVVWACYVIAYTLAIGPVETFRLDAWLALSGTSALANVISLRWKNRLYGMLGMAFVYGAWLLVAIFVLVSSLGDVRALMIGIGVAFYGTAATLNWHTVRHAGSGSAAYQPVPKFLDTPKGVS